MKTIVCGYFQSHIALLPLLWLMQSQECLWCFLTIHRTNHLKGSHYKKLQIISYCSVHAILLMQVERPCRLLPRSKIFNKSAPSAFFKATLQLNSTKRSPTDFLTLWWRDLCKWPLIKHRLSNLQHLWKCNLQFGDCKKVMKEMPSSWRWLVLASPS